jgi:hypothetical protein
MVVVAVSEADPLDEVEVETVGRIVEVLVGLTERLFEALTDTGGDADPLADLVRDIVGDIVGDGVAVPVWLDDLLFEGVTDPLVVLVGEPVDVDVQEGVIVTETEAVGRQC